MCRESRRESLSYDCKHEKTLINMKGTGYRLEMDILTNFLSSLFCFSFKWLRQLITMGSTS